MPSAQRVTMVTAAKVLRNPKIWVVPTTMVGLVALLLSLIYLGGILNPRGNLHRMPIGLVNADHGSLGAQITAQIAAAPDPQHQVSWRVLDQAAAQDKLTSGQLYGVLEVAPDFSAAVATLGAPGQPAPLRPTMTVLTNPGAGSLASSLATSISQAAAHASSTALGTMLTQREQAQRQQAQGGAPPSNAESLLLADPITVNVTVGHPIGTHSGLGLTAFYYSLLLVLMGFLGGNMINNSVDIALGYAASEFGPWRRELPTVPISRTQTLVVTSVMSVALSVLTSSLIMLSSVVILDMDASHLPLLWIYSVCATATVGLGTQALNAAFGGIGQLISMFIFIALSLPSSGATIPLQALPPFYKFLSYFEPMRQLSDGVRAILYFDARADAGLTRAWSMMAVGLVAALVFGFSMTRYYDRKGLHRITFEHPHPEPPAAGAPAAGG